MRFLHLSILITVLLGCLTFKALGTNYYISNGGNDLSNGLTQGSAWASISKINGRTFSPGDSILFRRGDTWREELIIPSSGSLANPLIFGAFGTGEYPKIYGSVTITQWTLYTGNIWRSVTTVADPTFGAPHDGETQGTSGNWPGGIFFKELNGSTSWGRRQKYLPLSNLKVKYDWVWSGGYIYVYSTTNPTSTFSSIEVAQRQSGINLNAKEYIVIRGLEINFACASGITETFPQANVDGITIDDCRIAYIGIKNAAAAMGITLHHSNSVIKNCVIHDCGRRGINLLIVTSGLTVENNVIENNTVYDCYHTGIDMILTANSTIRNITIRNNQIYTNVAENLIAPESYSMTHFFLSNQSGSGSYESIYLIGNTSTNPSEKGLQSQNIADLNIYNNTFYGINPQQNSAGAHIWIEGGTSTILNNILYSTVNYSFNANWQNLFISSPQSPTIVNHNLYFQQDNAAHFAQVGGVFYFTPQWNSYKSTTGYDANSNSPQNPLFQSINTFELLGSSPCIDAGSNVGIPFLGAGPDIGAREFCPHCTLGLNLFEHNYSNNNTPANLNDDYYAISLNVSAIEGSSSCSYDVLLNGNLAFSNLSCGQNQQFNLSTNGSQICLNLVENPVSDCKLTNSFEIVFPAAP